MTGSQSTVTAARSRQNQRPTRTSSASLASGRRCCLYTSRQKSEPAAVKTCAVVQWCGALVWCGAAVVVWWWRGGVVVWCGVVVVAWWWRGGAVVWWCGGVVVAWWHPPAPAPPPPTATTRRPSQGKTCTRRRWRPG